jgi:hypothetical protein
MYLYKVARTKKALSPSNMKGLQWFSLTPDYGGDTYGTFGAKYTFKQKPKLFNLAARRNLIAFIHEHFPDVDTSILSVNYQYSGGRENTAASKLLQKVLQPSGFQGTLIDNADLPDDDDDAGPSEVVLWSVRNLKRVSYFTPVEE